MAVFPRSLSEERPSDEELQALIRDYAQRLITTITNAPLSYKSPEERKLLANQTASALHAEIEQMFRAKNTPPEDFSEASSTSPEGE